MGHFQWNFHYLSTMGEYWASYCISTGSLLIKAVGVPLKVSSSTSYCDMCTQFQQSPIFHLIVIDFVPAHHILGLSLPNSTLLSNFLLSTFHTIVDFCTHMHLPNAYVPPPSTLPWLFPLFTIHHLCPTLPITSARSPLT